MAEVKRHLRDALAKRGVLVAARAGSEDGELHRRERVYRSGRRGIAEKRRIGVDRDPLSIDLQVHRSAEHVDKLMAAGIGAERQPRSGIERHDVECQRRTRAPWNEPPPDHPRLAAVDRAALRVGDQLLVSAGR